MRVKSLEVNLPDPKARAMSNAKINNLLNLLTSELYTRYERASSALGTDQRNGWENLRSRANRLLADITSGHGAFAVLRISNRGLVELDTESMIGKRILRRVSKVFATETEKTKKQHNALREKHDELRDRLNNIKIALLSQSNAEAQALVLAFRRDLAKF